MNAKSLTPIGGMILGAMLIGATPSWAGDSLTNGLVAYYPFEGSANDASGNGRHATTSGVAVATGYRGYGYEFDGTTSNHVMLSNCS